MASKTQKQRKASKSHIASMVDWTIEDAELMAKVLAYRAADPFWLTPGWGESEREYLARAKKLYRETTKNQVRRGRKSEASRAFIELSNLASELGRQPRYSEMIRCLKERGFVQKTAEKYERVFRLYKRGLASLSQNDRKWLLTTFGSVSLSQEWYLDKLMQCWEAQARTSGVLTEISALFNGSISSDKISKMRREMEKVRLKLLPS